MMRTKHPSHPSFLFALLCLFVLMGCERRELDYDYIDYAEVDVTLDWSKSGVRPDDATLLFYPRNGGKPIVHVMLADHEVLQIALGEYSIVVFNQKFDDFSSIAFRGTESYNTLQAYIRTTSARDDNGMNGNDLIEKLAIDFCETFTVTREMVEQTRTRVQSRAQTRTVAPAIAPSPIALVALSPRCVVMPSKVIVNIEGINNVRTAGGVFTGLAESVFLGTGRTGPSTLSQRVEYTQREYEEGSLRNGSFKGEFTTFGLCNMQVTPRDDRDPTDQPTNVTFLFDAVLVDAEHTKFTCQFDVTDKMEWVETETEIQIIINVATGTNEEDPPITIPDVKPEEQPDSGFDPDVDDWEDEEDVEMEM